jgi:hypothetical protein
MFSRPTDGLGRHETRPNSFRWAGAGTLRVLERGLLVIAKHRFPMGFHTIEERFVPASEICDVYREGNSVRVDLRGELPRTTFFQFWTADAATAGTIVRLLPTTRTIEYEESPTVPFKAPQEQLPYGRGVSARALRWSAVCVGVIGVVALILTNDRLLHRLRTETAQPKPVTVVARQSVITAPTPSFQSRRATSSEVAAARADLERFDARIDGLRAQYRMAFTALQYGNLSQENFINGLDQWLIPQWQVLQGELTANPPAAGSLDSVVRKHLIDVAVNWNEALAQYATGLREQSYVTVLRAFERMSTANQLQRQAFEEIDQAAATAASR